MEFLDACVEIADRMKSARNEVREEIAAERRTIVAAFRAEAAQLRFWNVIKHAKARIRFVRRLAGHRIKVALHPVAVRTRGEGDPTRRVASGSHPLHRQRFHPETGSAGAQARGLGWAVPGSYEAAGGSSSAGGCMSAATTKRPRGGTTERVLAAIRKNPYATIRELEKAVDVHSTQVIDFHIKKLIKDGRIERGPKYIVK